MEITLASPKGGQPPIDPRSQEAEAQTKFTQRFDKDAPLQQKLAHTLKLSSVKASDYDAVFYPGGHGPMWDLTQDASSIALIEAFQQQGKPMAFVCHAPCALLNVKVPNGDPLIKGKNVTGFSDTEEAGVKLALHPDDPPLAKMNGTAKLFTHYDGYHRAEQIAGGSKAWGLTFCVGTWMEGGKEMGKDVFEMIKDFGGRGKLFEVHFRNVTSPLPHFVETFPDEGYTDMYQVMKALREVRFTGAAEPDHVPQLAGDTGMHRAGTAYCVAYMRALLRRANEEVG